MARRQSGPRPPVWHSRRSRSARPRRSNISFGLVLCAPSHPFLSQSPKLIVTPDQINLGAINDRRHEMVVFSQLGTKFDTRIYRRVYLPAKDFLGRLGV